MGDAIGDDEVSGVELHVVGGDLVEDLLGDADVRGFVFDNHDGMELAVVEHGVGAELLLPYLQLHLVGHESGRVAEGGNHPVGEVLADPLLGGQGYPAASERVEDLLAALADAQFYIVSGEIKSNHFIIFAKIISVMASLEGRRVCKGK